MKLNKKQQDCNFENTIKIGIVTMYSSLMNPVFYLRTSGINRWVPKNENNYVEKTKYTKKIHVWAHSKVKE